MQTKKGELALNTVIVAIIVLVVLIIIIAFFAGGTGSVIDKIKGIFQGKTAGQDLSLAIQDCKTFCTQAKSLESEFGIGSQQLQKSAYCTKWFKLDIDNDGNVDRDPQYKDYIRYYCGGNTKTTDTENGYKIDPTGVGIGCAVTC